MSDKELSRINVIQSVVEKRMRRRDAAHQLREHHNITVSVETLRKWMTVDGLWVPYSRRRPRVSTTGKK